MRIQSNSYSFLESLVSPGTIEFLLDPLNSAESMAQQAGTFDFKSISFHQISRIICNLKKKRQHDNSQCFIDFVFSH